MPYTTEMILIHQMTDAMIDMLTYAQWARIRFAAERGGFDAGLRAMARVSKQIAAEKVAAGQEIAFLQGRIMGLQMMTDTAPSVAAAPASARRVPVDSSMIKSVGFTPTTYGRGLMLIEFCSGDIYAYDDVLRTDYDALMGALSIGSHFNRKIKPFYPGRKIDL